MDSEELCLKWNNHYSILVSVLDSLLEQELMVDVTLAAEGRLLRVHRLVLCACSQYFQVDYSQSRIPDQTSYHLCIFPTGYALQSSE